MITKIRNILAATVVAAAMFACDDYESNDTPAQLFRPYYFTWEYHEDEASAYAAWANARSDSFLFQISSDAEFAAEDPDTRDIVVAKTVFTITLDDLPAGRWYARVKALSNDPDIRDSEFTTVKSINIP